LYAQGFIASVLALLQLLFIVAALVAINSDHQSSPLHSPALLLASLKTASLTLLFAIPLLLFLFTVMPRMAPLWAMPLQKQQARTGMSDEMHPGDFDQLTQSSELVLRAGFSKAIPPAADLYWRGVVLDEFDGARWKNQCDCNYEWKRTNGLQSDVQPASFSQPDYRVVLEPHGNRWLFVLDNALLKDEAIWSNGENIFRYKNNVRERVSYAVWNVSNPSAVKALTKNELQRYTHIPVNGNLRAQQLANSWKNNVGLPSAISTEQLVQQALDYYHQSFFYTLTPPPVGKDSVDGFLFETRKGFCEHFASSFVFLMRAAGIPARVVMGYQGGQRNEENKFVTVRQFDAHAWAEVWQADKGWVRVDPTAAVAPERIALGFAEMFPDSQGLSAMLGMQSYNKGSLLGFIRMKLDYMDYLMGHFVLAYDADAQQSLFERWGFSSPLRLLLWFVVGFIGFFASFLIYLQWRDRHVRREHPLTARYRLLCEVYARWGVKRLLQETPLQFAERVEHLQLPEYRRFVALTHSYQQWNYGDANALLNEQSFRKDLRNLYWRLRWSYLGV
jgi:transglutaminase-like putative cysteine protease